MSVSIVVPAPLFDEYGTESKAPANLISKVTSKSVSYVVYGPCIRCGGQGGSSHWVHTGFSCYRCGGRNSQNFERYTNRLYTEQGLKELKARRQRKLEKENAKAKAEVLAAQANVASFVNSDKELGEYLVAKESEVDFFSSLLSTVRKYGKLTENQRTAALKVKASIDAREAAQEKAKGSVHVGKIGERRVFELTVQKRFAFESDYGVVYIFIYADADGNSYVYKGSSFAARADRGESVTFKATIVEHGERDGVKQTVLGRPAEVK